MNLKWGSERDYVVVAQNWDCDFDRPAILDFLRRYNVSYNRKEFYQESGYKRRSTLVLFYEGRQSAQDAKIRLCQLNKKERFKLQVRLHQPIGRQRLASDRQVSGYKETSYSNNPGQPRQKLRLPTLHEYEKATTNLSVQNSDEPYRNNRPKKTQETTRHRSRSSSHKSSSKQFKHPQPQNIKGSRSVDREHSRSRSRQKGLNTTVQLNRSSSETVEKLKRNELTTEEAAPQTIENKRLAVQTGLQTPSKDEKNVEESALSVENPAQTEAATAQISNQISNQNNRDLQSNKLQSLISYQQVTTESFCQIQNNQKTKEQTQLKNKSAVLQANVKQLNILIVAKPQQNNKIVEQQNKKTQEKPVSEQAKPQQATLLDFRADILRQKQLINLFLRRVPSSQSVKRTFSQIPPEFIDHIQPIPSSPSPRKRKS